MEGAVVVLALLACPVGMGLMMWYMGKNMKRGQKPTEPSSVEELRAEQQRIAAQLDQTNGQPPASDDRLAAR